MSYLTEYTLEVVDNPLLIDSSTSIANTHKLLGIDHEEEILKESHESASFEKLTDWATHTEDMCSYSMQYPALMFILKMVGEENEDYLVKYFIEGKYQVHLGEIVYPPFNSEVGLHSIRR